MKFVNAMNSQTARIWLLLSPGQLGTATTTTDEKEAEQVFPHMPENYTVPKCLFSTIICTPCPMLVGKKLGLNKIPDVPTALVKNGN